MEEREICWFLPTIQLDSYLRHFLLLPEKAQGTVVCPSQRISPNTNTTEVADCTPNAQRNVMDSAMMFGGILHFNTTHYRYSYVGMVVSRSEYTQVVEVKSIFNKEQVANAVCRMMNICPNPPQHICLYKSEKMFNPDRYSSETLVPVDGNLIKGDEEFCFDRKSNVSPVSSPLFPLNFMVYFCSCLTSCQTLISSVLYKNLYNGIFQEFFKEL